MPPPEPRSRTVSPALSLASAVGFPQPSDASIASGGISPACAASYRFEVMGSHPQLAEAAVAPQQELPPVLARSAASPYFSFTASLIFASAMHPSPLADLNYVARCDGFISGATLGVEKLQNFLQRLGVGAVAKVSALSADDDQAFVPQLVEVMRQRGIRNIKIGLDFTNDQAFGMGREEQRHKAEAWLGAEYG